MGIFFRWNSPKNPRSKIHMSPEVIQLINDIGLVKNVSHGEYIIDLTFYSDSYTDRHPLTGEVILQFRGPSLKSCGDSRGSWFYYDELDSPRRYGTGELSLVEFLQQLKERNACIQNSK